MALFDNYISLKEAATISGYHADYIGTLVRYGKIKGKKNGNRWFVSAQDVQSHFSKKHYTSANRAFFSKKNIFVGGFVFIVAILFIVYATEVNSSISTNLISASTTVNIATNTNAINTAAVGDVIIQQP